MKLVKQMSAAAFFTVAIAASGSQAGEIFLDVGTSYDGADGDSLTDVFTQFGFTQTVATSFYQVDQDGFTGTVIDTNETSRMNTLGFNPANQTAIDGSTVDQIPADGDIQPYDYPTDPTQRNVDTLENIGSGNSATEQLNTDIIFIPPGGGDPIPIQGWELVYDYNLIGTFDADQANDDTTPPPPVSYDEGYFDVFFRDIASGDEVQVFRLVVEQSETTGTSLLLTGTITYDWTGDGVDDSTAFAQSFLNDAATGQTYYDSWLNGAPKSLVWRLDTDVDPAFPTESQLVAGDGTPFLYRQTTLDGSIVVDIPEPSIVALLGMGLFGISLFSRRRRNA